MNCRDNWLSGVGPRGRKEFYQSTSATRPTGRPHLGIWQEFTWSMAPRDPRQEHSLPPCDSFLRTKDNLSNRFPSCCSNPQKPSRTAAQRGSFSRRLWEWGGGIRLYSGSFRTGCLLHKAASLIIIFVPSDSVCVTGNHPHFLHFIQQNPEKQPCFNVKDIINIINIIIRIMVKTKDF